MNNRIAVIADDLTGANDTGAQFAKIGLRTMVILETLQDQSLGEHDVVVITTDSRAIPPADAYNKVAIAAQWVKQRGYHTVYKKVDSTLRGNLGNEIEAIMGVLGSTIAVVAPAFPKNGRVTIGGYHILNGIPVEATEIAQDPKCPVHESHIASLISGQTKIKVGQIPIQTLLGGKNAVALAIRSMYEKGIRIVVSDIWYDEQFKILAEGAVATGLRDVLWVGSAGLAETLPKAIDMYPHYPIESESQPVLIVAGSVSKVTRRQVERLTADNTTVLVQADPVKFLTEDDRNNHISECCNTVLEALRQGRDAVLASGFTSEVVELTQQQGAVLGYQPCETSTIVANCLGIIVKLILEKKVKLSGMVLTGGDTAISVCRSLGAIGMQVLGEVSPGVPIGLLQGGNYYNMPVVTKAGAFGDELVLQKASAYLKQYSSQCL